MHAQKGSVERSNSAFRAIAFHSADTNSDVSPAMVHIDDMSIGNEANTQHATIYASEKKPSSSRVDTVRDFKIHK